MTEGDRAQDGADWLASIRERRRKQTLSAMMGAAALISLWLVLTGVSFWAWVAVFHQTPPSDTFVRYCEGLGSLITGALGAYLPRAPLKARKDPEVLAADEFFKGPHR